MDWSHGSGSAKEKANEDGADRERCGAPSNSQSGAATPVTSVGASANQ